MPIDPQALVDWQFEDVRQAYSQRDTMLYALGIGFGEDPLDEGDLRFVYEQNLETFPTMAVVLAGSKPWYRDPRSGVTWRKLLHASQGLTVKRPLLPAGEVVGRTRIIAVADRGVERGAMVHVRRDVHDAATDELVSTQTSALMLRGDGGCGSAGEAPARGLPKAPERAPDTTTGVAILPRQALLYRLSGDYNPLHADPAVSASAGFPAPILHGLCTYGIAARAVVRAVDPEAGHRRLREFAARFTSPVIPGEALTVETWREAVAVLFRVRAAKGGRIVLDNGYADFA